MRGESNYEINVFQNKKLVLIFNASYRMTCYSHNKETRIILDNLIKNNADDGDYEVNVLLIASGKRIKKRIYEVTLINKKFLKYKLVHSKNTTGAQADIEGEVRMKVVPIFIPDYTVYDVRQ